MAGEKRVDPFKKSTGSNTEPRRLQVKRPAMLDQEFVIHFHPWKALKIGIFALFILLAFFLGQWSVGPAEVVAVEGVVLEEVELEEKSSGGMFSFLSSLISGAATVDDIEAEEGKVEGEELVEENLAVVEEKAEEEPEPVNDGPQEIITEYNSIDFTLDKVSVKNMETWGSLKRLDVTITNNEPGIIEPYKVVMHMQGYDDREKEVIIPSALRTIKAGETVRPSLEVGSFSYNEKNVGNLGSVQIQLVLMNKKGKVMASVAKHVSLI